MDSMFEGMNKVLDKVETLVVSMNDIIGDPKFRESMIDMSENMKNFLELVSKESKEYQEKLNKIGVNEGEVMTQSAAAKYLLITRNTLVKHTAMGLVSNIPGTTKYRKSELDKYLAIRQRKK